MITMTFISKRMFSYRQICLKNPETVVISLTLLGISPAPGLAWDATLKETAVELESLTDSDMLLMTEKGNRGGISMISNRFARVNKKYLGEAHD